jgi:hypothetical protein
MEAIEIDRRECLKARTVLGMTVRLHNPMVL